MAPTIMVTVAPGNTELQKVAGEADRRLRAALGGL
jgi:hypothetical protein